LKRELQKSVSRPRQVLSPIMSDISLSQNFFHRTLEFELGAEHVTVRYSHGVREMNAYRAHYLCLSVRTIQLSQFCMDVMPLRSILGSHNVGVVG
jgi:hypothetical protein